MSASTASSGGLDTTSTVSVAGSSASARSACRVERPATAALRSRPPTPRQWLRPTPAASSRHMTCCAPVPDAATTPTDPGRTTLANPRATPPTWAVPQSGPMTSTSASAAASLRRTSSSTETLSENSITLRPEAMASKVSATACWPGTEMTARVAPERAAAEPRVRGATSSSPPPPPESPVPRSAASASVTAASPASRPSRSSARMATTRSLGPASSGTSKPMLRSTSTFSSVAIATWAAATPVVPATVRETCIRLTESWYAPRRSSTWVVMRHSVRSSSRRGCGSGRPGNHFRTHGEGSARPGPPGCR